jgi:hypothetical protein
MGEDMISIDLARQLRDAGLEWTPADGDRFFIPDRDLEGHTFSISQMTIDVRDVPGGQQIAFNGAVEWALDAIMQREVVWLPSEAQLRDRLGESFRRLERQGGSYRCSAAGEAYDAATAAEAYGLALLDLLERSPDVYPRLELDEL